MSFGLPQNGGCRKGCNEGNGDYKGQNTPHPTGINADGKASGFVNGREKFGNIVDTDKPEGSGDHQNPYAVDDHRAVENKKKRQRDIQQRWRCLEFGQRVEADSGADQDIGQLPNGKVAQRGHELAVDRFY